MNKQESATLAKYSPVKFLLAGLGIVIAVPWITALLASATPDGIAWGLACFVTFVIGEVLGGSLVVLSFFIAQAKLET